MDSITRTFYEQAKRGDRDAYDRLFSQYTDRAMLFIRARLGPKLREKIESQDILQDAYLAAHRDFAQFQYTDEGSFLRWLCRIIENRIRDAGDYFGAHKRQAIDVPRSNPTGPSTAAVRAEHSIRVAQAFDQLSEEHRQVLLLRYFEGLSAEEAGQRMARSSGAVRKLTARALAELGRLL